VKAIVAWDNLAGTDPNGTSARFPPGEAGCPADPSARTPAPITKPALGISADYGLPPLPNTSQPDPAVKSTESRQYTAAGVDTGELVIRGGSHLDFSFIPNQAFAPACAGRPDRLVHDRLVRQVRQGRPDRRSPAVEQPLAPRRRRGRDRSRP